MLSFASTYGVDNRHFQSYLKPVRSYSRCKLSFVATVAFIATVAFVATLKIKVNISYQLVPSFLIFFLTGFAVSEIKNYLKLLE